MTAPAITLVCTLQDFSGNDLGSISDPAALRIALCGFGATLPRVAGTAMLARTGPIFEQTTSGAISVPLYGNDVITPAGTYYDIALLDAAGIVIQSAAYQFTGSGTFELSSLSPYLPVQPAQPNGYVVVPYNATMAFDAAGWWAPIVFDTTLTGGVGSASLRNIRTGQMVQFIIRQDATGGHVFTWPANVQNPPLVNSAPNSKTTGLFFMDDTGNLYPNLGWN